MTEIVESPIITPPAQAVLKKPHIRRLDLDAVRGLAILLAMGWHFNNVATGQPVLDAILTPGRTFGWAGVDLFFVLSGFLIGGMIFHDETAHGNFDYPRFFVRRVMRLWPPLYVFLLFSLFLSGLPWQGFLWQIGLHVGNYFEPANFTHLWSLSVEEHFYLIVGVGIAIFLALKGKLRHLWAVMLAIMVLSPIARAVGINLGAGPVEVQWQTQYRMDALAGGVLLANLSIYHHALFDRLTARRWPWLILAALGAVFLWNVDKAKPLGEIVGYSVSYLSGMALLLTVYKSGFDRIGRPIWVAFAFLGQISYSAYLWHVPVLHAVKIALSKSHLAGHPAVQVIAEYTLTIIVAYGLMATVERWSIKLRDKWFPRLGEPAA